MILGRVIVGRMIEICGEGDCVEGDCGEGECGEDKFWEGEWISSFSYTWLRNSDADILLNRKIQQGIPIDYVR